MCCRIEYVINNSHPTVGSTPEDQPAYCSNVLKHGSAFTARIAIALGIQWSCQVGHSRVEFCIIHKWTAELFCVYDGASCKIRCQTCVNCNIRFLLLECYETWMGWTKVRGHFFLWITSTVTVRWEHVA